MIMVILLLCLGSYLVGLFISSQLFYKDQNQAESCNG